MDQLGRHIVVVFLALLQGVTELVPVRSLGHTVLYAGAAGLTSLSGAENIAMSATFLPTSVVIHLGTAAALLCCAASATSRSPACPIRSGASPPPDVPQVRLELRSVEMR